MWFWNGIQGNRSMGKYPGWQVIRVILHWRNSQNFVPELPERIIDEACEFYYTNVNSEIERNDMGSHSRSSRLNSWNSGNFLSSISLVYGCCIAWWLNSHKLWELILRTDLLSQCSISKNQMYSHSHSTKRTKNNKFEIHANLVDKEKKEYGYSFRTLIDSNWLLENR
jgi:hypothetical protein